MPISRAEATERNTCCPRAGLWLHSSSILLASTAFAQQREAVAELLKRPVKDVLLPTSTVSGVLLAGVMVSSAGSGPTNGGPWLAVSGATPTSLLCVTVQSADGRYRAEKIANKVPATAGGGRVVLPFETEIQHAAYVAGLGRDQVAVLATPGPCSDKTPALTQAVSWREAQGTGARHLRVAMISGGRITKMTWKATGGSGTPTGAVDCRHIKGTTFDTWCEADVSAVSAFRPGGGSHVVPVERQKARPDHVCGLTRAMMTLTDAIRRSWRLPAGVVLSAIVFVSLLLIRFPRDQILTFAARTEVAAFTTGDDVTTKFWIASGVKEDGPSAAECKLNDWLIAIARGSEVKIRSVADSLVISISHDTDAGTIGNESLGKRAWIRVCGPQDENLIVPFVGAFSIGEQVGPTTAAVLLDGRAEVVERVLFGSLTYVNRTVDLIRGDRLDVETPGHTARGFVHFSWNKDQEYGMFVRAQAHPGTAQLFRTPERPPRTLRGSLWGRLRDGADVGYLLLALSGLSALVQIMLFFAEPQPREGAPRRAPGVATVPLEPVPPAAPAPEEITPHTDRAAADVQPGTRA